MKRRYLVVFSILIILTITALAVYKFRSTKVDELQGVYVFSLTSGLNSSTMINSSVSNNHGDFDENLNNRTLVDIGILNFSQRQESYLYRFI